MKRISVIFGELDSSQRNHVKAELKNLGTTCSDISITAKRSILQKISIEHYDAVVISDAGSSNKQFKFEDVINLKNDFPDIRIIYLLLQSRNTYQDDDLVSLYENGIYSVLFQKDCSPVNIACLLISSRTKEEMLTYCNITMHSSVTKLMSDQVIASLNHYIKSGASVEEIISRFHSKVAIFSAEKQEYYCTHLTDSVIISALTNDELYRSYCPEPEPESKHGFFQKLFGSKRRIRATEEPETHTEIKEPFEPAVELQKAEEISLTDVIPQPVTPVIIFQEGPLRTDEAEIEPDMNENPERESQKADNAEPLPEEDRYPDADLQTELSLQTDRKSDNDRQGGNQGQATVTAEYKNSVICDDNGNPLTGFALYTYLKTHPETAREAENSEVIKTSRTSSKNRSANIEEKEELREEAERKRLEEERRQLEADKARLAEEEKAKEEQRQREEAERKRLEEERRQLEADKARLAEEEKVKEEQRLREEAERKRIQAEKARLENEKRKAAKINDNRNFWKNNKIKFYVGIACIIAFILLGFSIKAIFYKEESPEVLGIEEHEEMHSIGTIGFPSTEPETTAEETKNTEGEIRPTEIGDAVSTEKPVGTTERTSSTSHSSTTTTAATTEQPITTAPTEATTEAQSVNPVGLAQYDKQIITGAEVVSIINSYGSICGIVVETRSSGTLNFGTYGNDSVEGIDQSASFYSTVTFVNGTAVAIYLTQG